MTQKQRCAYCGKRIVIGGTDVIPRVRQGPEGLARCVDHLGEPLPEEEAETVAKANLEPVEGEDFVWAETRVYRVYFQAVGVVEWTGREDDSPHPLDVDKDEIEIQHENHREHTTTDRFKAWPGTDPPQEFDEAEWREQKLEALGLVESEPWEKPRPEESLEAFA